MSTATATVLAIIGEARIRTAKGELRTVRTGDVIQEGDLLITSPNGRVTLQFESGKPLEIEQNQTVAITAELAEATRPQSQDAEVASATVGRLLSAIEQTQATATEIDAASDRLGDTDNGNSFVRLLRVQERLDPLKFEYGTSRSDVLSPYDGGIVDETTAINDGYSYVRLSRVQERIAAIDFNYETSRPDILNPFNGGGERRILNQSPVTAPDSNIATEDAPLIVAASSGLLANDSDPDGGTLTVTGFSIVGIAGTFSAGDAATIAGVGTLLIEADGSYTFTPAPDFNGSVPVVTYSISDGQGGTNASTLSLVVNPVIDIANDAISTNEDTPATTSVLANDSFEGTPVVTAVTQGTHGSVVINLDNTLLYTPDPNYNGPDSYTYTVTSPTGITETTTVNVTVNPVNDTPVAQADTGAVNEDATLTISAANGVIQSGGVPAGLDSDIDGDAISVIGVTTGTAASVAAVGTANVAGNLLGTYGHLTLAADGSYTYVADTAAADALGSGVTATDTFSYAISDGEGGTAFTTLTITLTGTNDAPTVNAVLGDVTQADSTGVSIATSGGFADLDSDNVFGYSASGLPAGLSIDPGTGQITGTLNPDASQGGPGNDGVYSITVTATDSQGTTISQTFTFTATNPAPVAQPDTGAVNEDATLTVSVANGVIQSGSVPAGLDSDVDGDALQVIGVTTGTAASVAAVGTANVAGSLLGTYGHLTLAADGSYTYVADTAAADALGSGVTATDTFSYAISDGEGGTAFTTLTISLTGTNDAPTVNAVLGDVTQADSTGVSIATSGGFSDLDSNNVFGFSASGLPTGLSIDPVTGLITGTLNPDASQGGPGNDGVYSITVTATDSQGTTISQTFTFTATNPAPVAQPDTGAVNEDATLTVSVANGVIKSTGIPAGLDSDIDGDALQVIGVTTGTAASVAAVGTANVAGNLLGTYGHLTLAADGSYTYVADTAAADALGSGVTATDTFSYAISDGEGGTAFTTLTITLTGTNDAPTVNAVLGDVTQADSTGVSIATSGGFADLDSDNVFGYSASGLPAGLSIDPGTGQITGTLNPDASQGGPGNDGVYSITVTATDSQGATISQTFTFTATNPAPVAQADAGAVNEDATLTVSVANGVIKSTGIPAGLDSDIDGDALSVIGVSTGTAASVAAVGTANVGASLLGTYGHLTLAADGSYTYVADTAAADALGSGVTATDTFSYAISDGEGGTAFTTLTITLTGSNDAPTLNAVLGDVTQADSTGVSIATSGGFADLDSDNVFGYSASGLPAGLSIDPGTGQITGTLNPDASQGGPGNDGVYSITVTATDSQGATISQTFTFTATNPAPVAQTDTGAVNEDATLTVSVANGVIKSTGIPAGLDSDIDGDAISVIGVTTGTAASVAAVGTANVAGNLLGTYGHLTLAADGSYTYVADTAAADALGSGVTATDTFSYAISDGEGGTAFTTLTITLTGTNDAPTVNAVLGDVTQADSTGVSIATSGGFADLDSDNVFGYSASGLPAGLSIDPGTGQITGTLNPDASQGGPGNDGVYSITVTATDSQGTTISQTFTFTATNPAPVAQTDTGAVNEDATLTVSVANGVIKSTGIPAGLDSDIDGDAISVIGVTTGTAASVAAVGTANVAGSLLGTYGHLTLAADGSYTYVADTAAADALGSGVTATDTFSYAISDGEGGTAFTTLTISLTGTNDAPTANPDLAITPTGQPVTIAARANDTDPDATDTLSITHVNGVAISVGSPVNLANGTVALTADGKLVFTPNSGFTGQVSFPYSISDAHGGSSTATVTINVISVDIKDDSGNNDMLSSIDTLTASVLNGQIPAGGTLTSLVVSNGVSTVNVDPNTVTINPDGTFSTTFDATSLLDGTLTVTLNAQDAGGNSASTTDTILKDTVTTVTINPLNVTNDVTPAPITGNGEPGSSIAVKADGVTLGTVTVGAGGTWSYTPTVPLDNTVNEITADATDLYGNTANATRAVPTLEITDGNGGSPGHATVDEAALAGGSNPAATTESVSGSFTLGVSPDALTSIRVGGTDISAVSLTGSSGTPITIATTYGQIVINGFDSGTGAVSYRYDLLTDQTHPAGSGALTDAIAIRVVDNNGDIRNDTLNVDIVDDVPTPVGDPAMTLVEGGITITQASPGAANLLSNDTQGADGARVYDFTYKNAGGIDTTATVPSGGSSTVAAQFGSLTVFSNGNWSFTSNAAINHTTDGSSENASFSYRLIDGDGDISSTSAVQPISVTDTLPSIGAPDSDTVSEASLSGGSNPNAGALTQTGSLAVTKAADSIDTQFNATQTALNALSLTSGGVGLVYVISVDGHTLTATKGGGGATVFTVSLTNPTANSAGYSFVLSGTLDHAGAASQVLPFAFNVTDADTDVVSSQFNITVLDDSSSTQAHTLNEDSAQQTWNTQADATSSNTIITSAASHGTASINASGKLLYTPATHYSGSDTLTYQIDENGNVTTTTVNITVNPISDAPTLSRDAASVVTPEDTAVALGLNAPSVTDATDQNGGSAGDNPERLSLITLTGIPNGVQLLDGSGGDALLFTSTGAAITVLLSDAGNLVATPGAATLTLTTAQFEALKVNPVAQSASNFTVTMSVTEFEVDDANAPISGVTGATSTTTVAVDVQAVTDSVDLQINGGDAIHDASINEDTSLDLKALLSASFNDLDGSEQRAIIISNPVGNDTIRINGTAITAGNSLTLAYDATGNTLETSQTGFPTLSLQAPVNFSGDLNGITVKLSAEDTDGDSTVTTSTLTDTVTLNLHVNPIADDLTVPNVTTPEDTAVKFMQNVAVTDTGSGTEAITGISVMNLATGWVLKDHNSVTVHTGDGATDYTLPGADVTSLDYKNYTLTPPAHSSADISLTLSITSSDSNTVNTLPVTSTVTADHVINVTVTPVAEQIAGDTDGNTVDDLTMSGNHVYSTHGQEDTWFSLSSDGYVFETPWSNEDSNEQTFALLTPSLGGSSAAAIGSQFKYNDGSSDHVLTYVGTPVEIPVAFLDSVEFKAASNVAGFFAIDVQAKTVDTDPDTSATVNATSGSATLTNLAIEPAADNVTLSVVSPATGNEDTALPLVIRPTSADPSETFNVTISGIPPGTVSLVYDGVAQIIVAGSVTITNFDKTKSLTITPPPNSNTDFTLTVAAVSVDTAAGLPTSTSAASILPISVDILGVADAPAIATAAATSSESVVDAANGEIALSSLITSAALNDTDGSENLTLKITGLAAGFTIEGATFLLGAGSSRVWVLNPADVATAKLVVPENFSGTVNFSLIPITTENDGNSLTGAAIPLSATITPTPEATVNTSTGVNEDTLAQVSFALQPQHGDNDETLDSVWIKAADVDANPNFTLFYGNATSTPLADGLAGVVLDAGWYKLTGAAINNIYVKGADNLSTADSFDIRYEITDPASDASLAAVTTQTSASYSLAINAVTDAVTQSVNSITPSNANATVVGNVVSATGTTSLDIVIDITKQNDANAHNTPDTDGSESLIQLIIDGVPQGVSVDGAIYIGNSSAGANTGQWLLSAAEVFNTATVQKTVTFNLDGSASQLDNLDQEITLTTVTRDGAASTVNAQTSWTLQTAAGFDDSSNPTPVDPAVIDTWAYAPTVAMEDAAINANDIINAQISDSGPFSITLSNLPAGMGVSGMTLTQVNGIDTWTASGDGDNTALQALLSGISLTPPANLNSNTGNLEFNATLTTYASGSERNDSTLAISQVLTPVTDSASIAISAPDVSEGSPVTFSVQMTNPADGAFAGLIDGKLYLQVDASGLSPAGGSLSDSGGPLATSAVTGVAGVPDGNYYVIENVAFGDNLSFTFTPGSHASGSASLTAYLQGQETNAGNVVTSSGSDSFTIAPVNSGLDAGSFVVSATGDEDTRIALALTGSNLVDGDSSESVVAAVLKNVPNGFLVYVGANAGAAVLATNAGDDGLGHQTNIWSISPASGQLPAYLAILPPPNRSGTVTGLQLTVLTQETGLSPIETSASFDLTVTGVADGITLAPTLSFGEEGSQIALNLNATMVDTDGSETATLTVEGLGEFAAFFASGTPIAASYDSINDIYTLSGVSNTDVNNLTFIQSARVGTLTVTAFTSDGGDTSITVNDLLSIDISDSLATTGDDTLLYDGAALDGLAGVDVVQLRLGENLDFDAAPVKPDNIESLDLMPAGQNHSLANLSLQDVLDMTDSGKTLKLLGDAGDSVSVKNGVGLDVWSKGGSVSESGHIFDVYSNTLDPAVTLKIEQAINDSIV